MSVLFLLFYFLLLSWADFAYTKSILSVPSIPIDVLYIIFILCPNNLLGFMLVCKEWASAINESFYKLLVHDFFPGLKLEIFGNTWRATYKWFIENCVIWLSCNSLPNIEGTRVTRLDDQLGRKIHAVGSEARAPLSSCLCSNIGGVKFGAKRYMYLNEVPERHQAMHGGQVICVFKYDGGIPVGGNYRGLMNLNEDSPGKLIDGHDSLDEPFCTNRSSVRSTKEVTGNDFADVNIHSHKISLGGRSRKRKRKGLLDKARVTNVVIGRRDVGWGGDTSFPCTLGHLLLFSNHMGDGQLNSVYELLAKIYGLKI